MMASRERGVHRAHCNQGDYLGSCKYGDGDCPELRQLGAGLAAHPAGTGESGMEPAGVTAAHVTALLLGGCLAVLEAVGDDGTGGGTGAVHLAWMCREARARIGEWPIGRSSRWLGYVQGVMAARGLPPVAEGNDHSRPLLHASYRNAGLAAPSALERPPARHAFSRTRTWFPCGSARRRTQ